VTKIGFYSAEGILWIDVTSLSEEVERAEGFEELFRLVKRVVEEKLGLRRAGLMLVLGEIPNHILAFHAVGSNMIVMNRQVLELLEKLNRPRKEVNSYIFTVLLHEYLHSLGYIDEREVRWLVKAVIRESLGREHPAYSLATQPLSAVFPEVASLGPGGVGQDFKIVRDFDRENATYIG